MFIVVPIARPQISPLLAASASQLHYELTGGEFLIVVLATSMLMWAFYKITNSKF